MTEISMEERTRLKGLGFLSNNDQKHFSLRVLSGNGALSAAEMCALGEIAAQYGNGEVCLTGRLTLELPGICYENTAIVSKLVEKAGLLHGGTGPKVRPVVACKGRYCIFGLCDSQAIAQDIHERFYIAYHNVILPHKFKIAVGGCPNNCIKPDLNDFGIAGRMQDGKRGYKIYLGGRWGKATRHGSLLNGFYEDISEVMTILEKCILLYRERGFRGERFSMTIDRLGMPEIERLLQEDILARKDAILAAPIKVDEGNDNLQEATC